MNSSASNEAAKPNPALAPFGALVGEWRTVGTHPMVPGAPWEPDLALSYTRLD